jgi:hypothetical protein
MAKLLGQLVGQPVQNLQASGYGLVAGRYKDGHDTVLWRDYVVTQGNLIGDQISFGTFKSNAYIDHGNSYLWWTAFGAGCTLNIGDVNHPNTLAAALAIAAVGTQDFEVSWAPPWIGQPLWQHLGYATDPGGSIEILGTFAGAAPANGASLAWQLLGHRG